MLSKVGAIRLRPPNQISMIKLFLRNAVLCCCFMTAVASYSQSFILNPDMKDSLGVDSVSYKVSGILEFQINDSMEFQLDLVEIHADSLQVVYQMKSGFNQAAHPTNSLLSYDSVSGGFEVSCGIFASSNLMVHLLVSKDGEKIGETYFK